MRTASPWWASLVLGISLLLVFVGERLFGYDSSYAFLSWIGGIGVVAVTAARGYAMMNTTGGRRRVERVLFLAHVGTLLALALYLLSTAWGTKLVGVTDATGVAHYRGALTALWIAVMLASLVPVLMIELSLGSARRDSFDLKSKDDGSGVEYLRVRDIGWSGLSVAFAAAFLMVTCQVAQERNVSRDVSFFKTSAPGESTKNIVGAQTEPLKVLLFFPEVNEVKEQVKDYFESLSSSTGKLAIEEHDRQIDTALAQKYKVTKDGTVVLVRGTGDKEKSQTLDIDTDFDKARRATSKLRTFDKEVNTALLKVVREKRKIYLLTGHGELNDPDSVPLELKDRFPPHGTQVFKTKVLAQQNLEVKDLTAFDLRKDVPDDATELVIVGGVVGYDQAEIDSLGRYLDRGGSVVIAFDPRGNKSLGALEGRLGVKMADGTLTDEVNMGVRSHTLADRRIVVTSQFTSHATTATVSRSHEPQFLIESGALEDVPFTPGGEAPKKTITVRSMDTAFLDYNDNFAFDAAGDKPEKKQKYNVAAAIEGPKKDGKDGFRAVVFADANLFADVPVSMGGQQVVTVLGGFLIYDSIKWAGREEVFSGEIVTEDDKPIAHTKGADTVWFTLMTVGAPVLVFALGVVGTRLGRRRSKKGTVTP